MFPREIDLYTSNSSPLFESQTLMFCHNCVSRNKIFVKISPSSSVFHESGEDWPLKYALKIRRGFANTRKTLILRKFAPSINVIVACVGEEAVKDAGKNLDVKDIFQRKFGL